MHSDVNFSLTLPLHPATRRVLEAVAADLAAALRQTYCHSTVERPAGAADTAWAGVYRTWKMLHELLLADDAELAGNLV